MTELPRPPEAAFYATPERFEARAKAWRASVDPATGELAVSTPRDFLALATVAVSRERSLWEASTTPVPSLAHGELSLPRGAVTERLAPRVQGIEQSWTFPELPRGAGDLVVRVRARGSAPLRPSGDELHAGSLRVRDAAWVDARGERTPIPLAASGDGFVLRVPADVLSRSAYPATLDPTIGPELAIDAPIVGVHDGGTYSSKVAVGKSGTALVAWVDDRGSYRDVYGWPFTGSGLYVSRVSSAGAVLDPTGIPIWSERDARVESFAMVYDGVGRWFIAWHDDASFTPYKRLFGAIIDGQGKIVSVKEAPGGAGAEGLAAGFDGTNFVVALSVDIGGGVFVTRFSTAGVPLDLVPTRITGDRGVRPAIACRPGECLVAWGRTTGQRFASRIRSDLSVVDTTPIALPSGSGYGVAGVVFDGQRWVVGYGSQVALVAPTTGAVAGPVALTGSLTDLAWDGTHTWLVRDGATGQIEADRVTIDGTLVAGSPLSLTTSAAASSGGWEGANIDFAGPNGFVTWRDTRVHGYGDVFVSRVTPAGASLDGDGLALNKAANEQHAPSVAASSTGYLVGWTDWRSAVSASSRGVYVTRLDANGAPLDASAMLVEATATRIAVASDGVDYLVLHHGAASGVRAARVSSTTGALLGAPFQVSASGGEPQLAYDGAQYIAAWDDDLPKAAAIPKTGSSVGPVSTLAPSGFLLGLAPGGGSTLAVISDSTTVSGIRFDPGGTVLDPTPFPIGKASGATGFRNGIVRGAVAWDGTQWVVAWEDRRSDHYSSIYAARVAPDGSVKTPTKIAISTGISQSAVPAVIGMNDDYAALVAWEEARDPTGAQDFGLYGAWVRRFDGKLLDPQPVVLSDAIGNERYPSLAPAGKGRALLVYQAYDGTSGIGAERIRARFIGSGTALGAACGSDAECVSRNCTDGVCCERPCRGACEVCGQGGKCASVSGADDPDSCSGDDICSATSSCQRKPGRGCVVDSDCTTGHCSRGICCDRACDGACESCAPLTGVCERRGVRTSGAPSCAPYACDGQSATCPGRCASDDACPIGARCDVAGGVCVSGASCLDRSTVIQADGTPQSCLPYTCSAGTCRTACRSVEDCAPSFVCDEVGVCAPPPRAAAVVGACAASPTGERSRGALLPLAFAAVLVLRRARSRTRCAERSA